MPSSLFSSLRSSAARGTFLYDQDATEGNLAHWLALVEALRARDLKGIVEHLPMASGTLSTRTRNNTLRKGRLPHRVEALLEGSATFQEHQRRRAERAPRWPDDAPRDAADMPHLMHALDLLVWAAPDLVAPMLLESHRAAQREPKAYDVHRRDPTRWIGESGHLCERLAQGGVRGQREDEPWNPHWPALVSAMATACLDRFGDARHLESTTRDQGRTVYGSRDSHLSTWLQNNLASGITREDDTALSDRRRGMDPEDAAPVTVWQRTLQDALDRGDREGWDLPTWQRWARRWMLATDTQPLKHHVADVAAAFWQRWPEAHLPLRRSDSVAPATLLNQPTVFTDERLADWLVHGDGSIERRAQCSGTRWKLVEDAGWSSGGQQPWTWMEWAVELNRTGVAQRLAHVGWRLFDGFETTYLPLDLPSYLPTEERDSWPARKAARYDRVDAVRLTEAAYDAAPTLHARSRSRL